MKVEALQLLILQVFTNVIGLGRSRYSRLFRICLDRLTDKRVMALRLQLYCGDNFKLDKRYVNWLVFSMYHSSCLLKSHFCVLVFPNLTHGHLRYELQFIDLPLQF